MTRNEVEKVLNAFQVVVEESSVPGIGKEATFRIKVTNNTDRTLVTDKICSLYYHDYENDVESKESFGVLSEEDGAEVAEALIFAPGESRTFQLSGIMPGTWNERSVLQVNIEGHEERNYTYLCYGQGDFSKFPLGDGGTGDESTGDSNTGDESTGDGGTGDDNTGDGGTGDSNTGDDNTGNEGTGNAGVGNSDNGSTQSSGSEENNSIGIGSNFGGNIILAENGMYEVNGLNWNAVNRGLMGVAVQEMSALTGRNVDVVTGGEFEIPAYVLNNLAGRNATLALHVGRGLALSITGSDLVEGNHRDFAVRMVPAAIPEAVNQQVVGNAIEHRAFNLECGEELPIHVNVHMSFSVENAGRMAVLYRFDRDAGVVEVVSTFRVNKDGQAMFGLTRGGEYTAVVLEDAEGIMSYTVVAGDTFRRIASKHGMTIEQMKAVNPEIKNINKIRVGQILHVSP